MTKKIINLCFPLMLITLFSCSRINEIEDRLDVVEQEVKTFKEAVKALESAYNDGKIITNVGSIDSGFRISFSDNTSIDINNGKDGITPLISIDSDRYWTVSYDGGKTYSKLTDNNGNNILSIGKDGVDGQDGKDGTNGKDGICIRVTTNDKGYYIYELYAYNDPETVIETIITPFTSDKSRIINSITQDITSNEVTITMANGATYSFNKKVINPASIAILQTTPLYISAENTTCLEFRVNPSNATFNFDTNSDNCEISIDRLGGNKSYVTTPSNYVLSKVEQAYDEQGVAKKGQYKAYITDLGNSTDYNDNIALVITTKNDKNEELETSSSAITCQFTSNTITEFAFLKKNNPSSVLSDITAKIDGNTIKVSTPYISNANNLVATFTCNGYAVLVNGIEQKSDITNNDFSSPVSYRVVDQNGEANEYTVIIEYSGLPIVEINTPNSVAITSKEIWTENSTMKIINPDGSTSYEGTTSIRGRGNSTWGYPKKPYAIKLDKKASILGMPKHKRWVLLANWMDRTLMRNCLAFKLGSCTQMNYTPRGQYVELVLNGKHLGNYFLCEQIKIDENRVNIHEIEDGETDVTGGFLIELDTYYDEVNKFKSSIKNLPYMFKEPDEDVLTADMLNYMQNYVNTMEDYLFNSFKERKWNDYIDINTFIDYWFAVELTSNSEPDHPKSVYMHKDNGGKLCMGPMWDYDWNTFVPNKANSFMLKKYLYYPNLFNDAEFVAKVKERWTIAKVNFDGVSDYIDEIANKIRNSSKMNIAKWPISSRVNGDETMTFDESIARLKKSFTDKLSWLDQQIQNM